MGNMKNLSLEYLKYHQDNADKFLCIAPGCDGRPERHHLARIGQGRDKNKPHWEHFTIVGICAKHHIPQAHMMSDARFEAKYNVNLWKTALLNLAKWLFEKFN